MGLSVFWSKPAEELTVEELQEAIDDAREFVELIDADPICEGGAEKERLVLKLAQEELERRRGDKKPHSTS